MSVNFCVLRAIAIIARASYVANNIIKCHAYRQQIHIAIASYIRSYVQSCSYNTATKHFEIQLHMYPSSNMYYFSSCIKLSHEVHVKLSVYSSCVILKAVYNCYMNSSLVNRMI